MARKSKAEEEAEAIRRRQIEKVLKEINPQISIPKEQSVETYPREYIEFLKEIRTEPRTFYEKATTFFGKTLNIEPDASAKAKLDNDIRTSWLNTTPAGVMSLTIFILFISFLVTFGGIFFKLIDPFFGVFLLMFGLGITYLTYNYPSSRARALQIKMNADMVLAILYMVIYMRNSPNLEGAVRFSSGNLVGPLSWDLKKLLWDVEVGAYQSMDMAVVSYITKWKDKNQEFSEALHLLRNAVSEGEIRREAVLNESIDVILNGTKERMKHYAQNLRMPVMLVHAMGVLLPLMGLVMLPVTVIFMPKIVKITSVFVGYNILLPAFLLWYMNKILETKPPTFSQPDISQVKGLPPLGKFSMGRANVPIWPIAALVAVPLMVGGFLGISVPDVELSVYYSLLLIVGLGLATTVYCFLDSFQKIKVRNDIERIENEFAEALFQLGNQIAGGTPLELAVDRATENLKGMKISEFFYSISLNMKKLGMTFEEALFDKEYGAIWHYPSTMIRSVMKTVIESAEKSVRLASLSMLTISRYLKGVHVVKEEITEILGETTTSMRFLGFFLAPLVAGVTLTMAVVMIQIMTSLSTATAKLSATATGLPTQGVPFLGLGQADPISPVAFQLVVGLYMIEIIMLLSFFVNKIEYGEDEIGLRSTLFKMMVVGVFMYVASWAAVYTMFGGPLKGLMQGMV